MIISMTGFGRGDETKNNFQVTVEIKTLNSRYLDISVRTPHSIQDKEFTIKEAVQKVMSRGKAHVSVNVEKTSDSKPDMTFNEAKVKSYSQMLQKIKSIGDISEPIQVWDLMKFEDIFETKKEDEKEIQIIWQCTQNALDEALNNLNKMRKNEGAELKTDLKKQIKSISEMLAKVAELSKERAPEVREKLHTRIKTLTTDENFDPERMEMEVALLVDKMDINEEIIRLQSHLKFFLEALESDSPVGRRLNFLCQEINRELNTIGSKANDSEISQRIVLGKESLEKIREQVQNIE